MSEGIKAQYQILADIRQVDEKIVRLHLEAEHIPAELAKLEAALTTRRDEFNKVKTHFETAEKGLRKIEMELREKEDKLKKAEGKMMEVKTNEEYQAAIKENEVGKNEKQGLEEQVLKLITEVEEQRKQLKQVESGLKDYEATIGIDKKKLEEERARVVALLEQQAEKKSQFTSRLTPEVGELYERVSARARGVPIVSVENGMCLGCNMKIRPQLYNEVIGYKMLHRCPSCGRILIISPKETSTITGEELMAK